MPTIFESILETKRCDSHSETLRDRIGERRLLFYEKGQAIETKIHGIWQVCKGYVQVSTLYPSGEEGLVGWVGPSMCFGSWLTSLQTYQAKAQSDVYLTWYPMAEIESSPTLAQQLLPQMNRRLRQVEALLAIAGQRRVEARLQQLLQLLKQEMGETTPQGTRIGIRLTHQEIANAISTSRVTITRLLSKFQNQGILSFDAQRHIILKKHLPIALEEGSLLKPSQVPQVH
ncbi:Crp/Fnr family transcriptional regulator [Geitlerinema sp. PCC 9228]|uniref:Crp/Fnr family transcriptional regulator n=1 Tax=Geitlerinema sp. PCC 9228 TaxID=111611 RepID=UPI000A003EF5|nr:Crp/Fnr family transcriptional regulator [Geitlerinema sp. PCC 9228]